MIDIGKIKKKLTKVGYGFILEISENNKIDNEIDNLFVSVKNRKYKIVKNLNKYNHPEHLIRNFLLENPGLFEYLFPEILFCFSEVKLFKHGVGALPDILLGQASHRRFPRRYMIVELKLPNLPFFIKSGRRFSAKINEAITQQGIRNLYGIEHSEFYNEVIEKRDIKGICIETLILAGSQFFHGDNNSIPFNFGKNKVINKNQRSDAVLGLRKMLSPSELLSYDTLLRRMMQDIIFLGPKRFDSWINKKSTQLKKNTNQFAKEISIFEQYNPYIDTNGK